jgi:outer membrane protein OmpA-like peptidoglycan-associated protein
MRGLLMTGLLVSVVGAALPSRAQTPSADQMIDALSTKDVAAKCPPGVAECRGIRAAAPDDAAADSEAAPVAARPGHQRPMVHKVIASSGSLDLSVEFPSGSADITPPAAHQLSRLAEALASPRLASSRFRIEGHTDTVGDADQNQSLSEKRADSVVSFLENNGIAKDRLEPVGVGEKDLAVPTPAQTPEMRNRRVHIVNLGAS